MSVASSPEPRRSTLEEWAGLDEDDSSELVDGTLEEAEVPDAIHEVAVAWLLRALDAHVRPRGGWVFGSGLKLAVGPRRGRLPDLSVFLASAPPRRGLVRTPPDVIVEVVSPTPADQRRDRIAKVDEYALFGARFYWLVDPELRALEVLELRDGRYARAAAATEGVLDVPGLDGLRLDLDALWAEIDRLPPPEDA